MPRMEEQAKSWPPSNPGAETLASNQSCATGSRHLTSRTHICGHQPLSFTESQSTKKRIYV